MKSLVAVLAVLTTPPAFAQTPFDSAALDDGALAVERGTFQPSFLLTVRQLKRFQDDAARQQFGLTSSVGSIIMDNWWAGEGAQLIEMSRAERG